MAIQRSKTKTDALKFAEGEALLAQDQSENIAVGERVKGLPNPNPPITIRMTPALGGRTLVWRCKAGISSADHATRGDPRSH
jgi:hypothetical protein